MKYVILFSILIFGGCSPSKKVEVPANYDAWLHRSEWRANSFGHDWSFNSSNKFTQRMPIYYKTIGSEKDYHLAIEMADLDSTLGTFDSLQIRYRSNLDLSCTIALLPEDKHGFELSKERGILLPSNPGKTRLVTLTPNDFGKDWNKQTSITLFECNNIAIANSSYLKPGKEYFLQIEEVRIYK